MIYINNNTNNKGLKKEDQIMYSLLMNVLGGLAIFVFGMQLMSHGLQSVAGKKMQKVLEFFSANRFVAILSGTVVTAVIQSSGATTVMVIGFINAGLLNLTQALGIIFGANIGTTVTAQLVAFDIKCIVMPSIIIGLALTFFKPNIIKGWGETILGLGLLFYGMGLMSGELKVLSSNPTFLKAFQTFDCAPINGSIPLGALLGAICIGVIATVITQSSSAVSVIVIALGSSGLINIFTAVALILGSNIGSTATAQLASITANRVAKQAALAHTLFNTIGVLLICATFWWHLGDCEIPVFFQLVEWLSKGGDLPRKIANAHTIFNICTTLILVMFIPVLAKICETIIPLGSEKLKFKKLEPHLLDTPAIALNQTVFALKRMICKSWTMVNASLKIYNQNDEQNQAVLKTLEEKEEKVDLYQQDITDYLSQLMERHLTHDQTDRIPQLIHCTNDAERIGDHALLIRDMMEAFFKKNSSLSEDSNAEYNNLFTTLQAQAESTIELLEKFSLEKMGETFELSGKMKLLCAESEKNHLDRLKNGLCKPENSLFYLELVAEILKVSRHFENIAERAGACVGRTFEEV